MTDKIPNWKKKELELIKKNKKDLKELREKIDHRLDGDELISTNSREKRREILNFDEKKPINYLPKASTGSVYGAYVIAEDGKTPKRQELEMTVNMFLKMGYGPKEFEYFYKNICLK